MIDITDIIGIVQEEREQDLQEESTDHFPATVRLFDDHSTDSKGLREFLSCFTSDRLDDCHHKTQA